MKIRQGKGPFCQKNLTTQSIPISLKKKVGHRPISSKESKDSIYSIPTFSHSRDVPQTDGSKQCISFYLYPWKIKLLCSLDIKCLSPLPVGVSMCLFRDTARPQDSLHCAHLCTFFPVWIIMCVLRWPAWLNDLFPIIASRYLFRLNDIGWRTGKGINVTSYAESPGILSQMFYHKFRIWTRWHSVWRGSSQDVFWENRWVCSSYHNKNKKMIRPQALQTVGAVVAARELLYRIRCLKGQSLSRSCSTWSSQHNLDIH